MTVHVLHAGDGYTYLTRRVASGDHHRRRGEALADYYTAAGNPPGRWVGTGLAAMGVDSQINEAQMKALFGEVCTPTPTPVSKRHSAAAWTARQPELRRQSPRFPAAALGEIEAPTSCAMTLLPGVGFGREGPTLSER